MSKEANFREALLYIFPENFVVTADIEYLDTTDPQMVRYEPGAIGFELVKIAEVETEEGEIARFFFQHNEYFYWGQKVSLEELENHPSYDKILAQTDSGEFCLTSWGGLISLDEEDNVIPYPSMVELPADLRM